MQITSALTSTGNIVAATPKEFFDKVSRIFNFTLDACALPENAKCSNYYTPEDDGLSKPWRGGVWCNPPYGREIGRWCEKAYTESRKDYNDFVLMLIPARSDTKWWWDWVQGRACLFYVKGRIKFGDHGVGAPFPSVLALYMKDIKGK
jgi:site-specific DNA-methyltransferase (adenine-specific)